MDKEFSKIVVDSIMSLGIYATENSAYNHMSINNLLPASNVNDDEEDRKVSKYVEEKYNKLGIKLLGVKNVPEKQMLVGSPGQIGRAHV
jgi:hypothetical protein